MGLGNHDARIRDRAMKAAAKIGPVEVDPGQTGCVTPDAASYVRRAESRRAKTRRAKTRA